MAAALRARSIVDQSTPIFSQAKERDDYFPAPRHRMATIAFGPAASSLRSARDSMIRYLTCRRGAFRREYRLDPVAKAANTRFLARPDA